MQNNGKILNDKFGAGQKENTKMLSFNGGKCVQYWQSNGNKPQEILVQIYCSKWNDKILNSGQTTF